MRSMTAAEQTEHEQVCLAIRSALSTLRLTRCQDEDVRVAAARLGEWLENNDGRWVTPIEPAEVASAWVGRDVSGKVDEFARGVAEAEAEAERNQPS